MIFNAYAMKHLWIVGQMLTRLGNGCIHDEESGQGVSQK